MDVPGTTFFPSWRWRLFQPIVSFGGLWETRSQVCGDLPGIAIFQKGELRHKKHSPRWKKESPVASLALCKRTAKLYADFSSRPQYFCLSKNCQTLGLKRISSLIKNFMGRPWKFQGMHSESRTHVLIKRGKVLSILWESPLGNRLLQSPIELVILRPRYQFIFGEDPSENENWLVSCRTT